ncbi:MAG: amidohydrolase family protein [Armatimonadota bacterium]
MIVDCHAHVRGPFEDRDDPWEQDRLLLEACDALGIDVACVSHLGTPRPATPDGFREVNRKMLKSLEEFRGRFWGYCYVNPGWTAEALEEIDYCLGADEDCIGVKLYNEYKINDPVVRPVIEKCIEHDVPILEHAGYSWVNIEKQPSISTAADIVDVGEAYPEAKLIVAHLGGGGDWEWAVRAVAAGPPNVGADISGSVVDEGLVEYAVEKIGDDRLYFACDMSMTAGMGKLQYSDISEEARQKIGGENFLKLIGREA